MDKMEQTLTEMLPVLGLTLPQDRIKTLCDFGRAVVEQNKVMNLTAITEPEAVAKLHLLDSLTLLAIGDLSGKKLIDVGCGAGFPGVPVKIACPEIELTLLDSLGKRMTWLERILPELEVQATCITARAEEAVADRREQYDIATSRAVARLNILLELTAPFVKVGGFVLAMKGAAAEDELQDAQNAIKKLGLKLVAVREFPVEETAHKVIILQKVAKTPPQFPRRYAKIKQSPL